MSFQKMYGFEGVGLSGMQLSISELSVVGGGWWVDGTNALHGRTFTGSDNQTLLIRNVCQEASHQQTEVKHNKPHLCISR